MDHGNQLCLVAADVLSKDMADSSSSSNSLYRHCVRLTNYYNPYDSVLKLSNVKRVGVAPRAGRVGLPHDAPAKAVGVDCGARFLKTHPVTNPVVDHISQSWYFDDPVFLQDLTLTLAGDIDRNVIPTKVATAKPLTCGGMRTDFIPELHQIQIQQQEIEPRPLRNETWPLTPPAVSPHLLFRHPPSNNQIKRLLQEPLAKTNSSI